MNVVWLYTPEQFAQALRRDVLIVGDTVRIPTELWEAILQCLERKNLNA